MKMNFLEFNENIFIVERGAAVRCNSIAMREE